MGYIYMLKSPSGKIYIGQTIRPIEKRLKEHREGKSKRCRAIYNAIQYHGWENIEKDWYYCPDEDLNKHEELMVEVLGTLSPGGYNLKEGGGNRGKASEETRHLQREVKLGENNPMYGRAGENNPMYGKKHSEETKHLQREVKLGENNPMYGRAGENNPMYGKKHTKEAKQKMKKINGGENNPMYGKTHSDEAKQKQREAKLGKNNPNYGKTPSEETKQKLRKVNLGENNPMFGKMHTEESKQRNREANSGENHPKSKRIYQYDLDGTFIDSFASSGDAGRHFKKKNGSIISTCARGNTRRKNAYGFKWSYTLNIFM